MKKALALCVVLLIVAAGGMALGGELVVNSNAGEPGQKVAWQEVVSGFEKENPDIKVKYTIYDMEAYKTAIRNWLASE